MNSAIRTFFIFTIVLVNSRSLFGMQESQFNKSEQNKNSITIVNEGAIPFTISLDDQNYEVRQNCSIKSAYTKKTLVTLIVQEKSTSFYMIEAINIGKNDKLPANSILKIALTPDSESSNLVLNAKYLNEPDKTPTH